MRKVWILAEPVAHISFEKVELLLLERVLFLQLLGDVQGGGQDAAEQVLIRGNVDLAARGLHQSLAQQGVGGQHVGVQQAGRRAPGT